MKKQLKQFFQQMIIIQALFAFVVLAPIAQANAKSPFTSQWLNDFNYSWSLESQVNDAKTIFTTKQDHKDLDALYNEYKDKPKDWKFELDELGLAFWQNNEKKAIINSFDSNSVTVNGKKITISKGLSFKKFQTDFINATKKKNYSLKSLFIDEADALFFLAAAVAGVALIASSRAKASGKNCKPQKVDFAYTLSKGKFKNNSKCSDMPKNYNKRIKLVSKQFKPGKKFDAKAGTSYGTKKNCISQYTNQDMGKPQAIQLCKCIHKKQQTCAPRNNQAGQPQYGWNMKLALATQTCMVGYRHWKNPCPGTGTGTTAPSDTYEPPTCDKTKTGSGSCGKTTTIYKQPKRPYVPVEPASNYKTNK